VVTRGQHLVEILLVTRHLDLQVAEHLPGQRPVHGRGQVRQEHRNLRAHHPGRDEEVIADGSQADRAAEAGLPPQCREQARKVPGERHRQGVGLPGVVLPVDDDSKIRAVRVCHRHLPAAAAGTGCPCGKWCQIGVPHVRQSLPAAAGGRPPIPTVIR
jgi:hypothetical protein